MTRADDLAVQACCPLCSGPGQVLYEKADLPVYLGVVDHPETPDRLPFTLCACLTCGHVFQPTRQAVIERLTQLYRSVKTFLSTPLGEGRQGQERLEWWLETFADRPAGRVLEIGCATGQLILALSHRGWRGVGIDPTPLIGQAGTSPAVRFIQDVFPGPLTRNEEPFDLVVANLVIEHVPEPLVFLRDVASLLRVGSRAILSVPNNAERLVAGYPAHVHEHFGFYTPSSFRRLLREAGFVPLDLHDQPDAMYIEAEYDPQRARSQTPCSVPEKLNAEVFQSALQETVELLEGLAGDRRTAIMGACAASAVILHEVRSAVRSHIVVVDGDPGKAGRFLPGFEQPIVHESELLASELDGVLVVPWGYRQRMRERARKLWPGVEVLCFGEPIRAV